MKQDRRSTTANNKRVDSKIASKIAPRLYLTCLATAKDVTQLANLGITHVVSAMEDAPTFPPTYPLRTLHISISDYDGEDILTHLPSTTSFIRGALAESPKNRVLVHCFMGISRSTTVVIAYLIATTKMTPREALAAVGKKRAIVRPNRGFMSQLQEYYSQSSNSLQAQLSPDDSVPPPEEDDGKRRRNVMASWRGGGKWGPKKLSENNALAVASIATSLLSRIPSRLGGQESCKSEKLTS